MWKRIVLIWLAATRVWAAPLAEDSSVEVLEARACTVSSNALSNPGFESGSLTSWVYAPTYTKLASAGVVSSGQNSKFAAQLSAISGPTDPTSVAKLSQTVNICKNATFQLKWSILQVTGGTVFDTKHPYYPTLDVSLRAPNTYYYALANFRFDQQSYNSTVYTPALKGKYTAGSWTSYVATFPFNMTGNWTAIFQWSAAAPSDASKSTTLKWRLDNTAIVLK